MEVIAALLIVVLALVFVFLSKNAKTSNVKSFSVYQSIGYFANKQRVYQMYKFFLDNKLEGFYSIWQGPKRAYLAVDPEAVRWVLSQREETVRKAPFPKSTLNDKMSKNVVIMTGEDWRRHRQVYNPVFNNSKYQEYYDKFEETVDKCLAVVSNHLSNPGGDINFLPIFSQFTLDLLGKSVFNYDFGCLDGKNDDYYLAYKTIFTFDTTRMLYMFFPWLDKIPLPSTVMYRKAIRKLDELFDRLVKQRQTSNFHSADILTHLLSALQNEEENRRLSHEEMQSNIFILFVAGHETTSTSLSWMFYELAKHPEIQQKIFNEVNSVVGDKSPTIEELDKMEYLDQTISENLRVHPPVSSLATREAVVDLQYKDMTIPKGALVGFNIYNVHHHPAYWPDPLKFDPDRFSPENSKGRHKHSYMPFSLGPRMCLGNVFSLIEQRLFLAKFLQKFQISQPTTHSLSNKFGTGIGSPESIWVSITPRAK